MTAIDVNPLELIIAFLEADTDVLAATGGRIAPRHKYGQQNNAGWSHADASLVVQLAGGQGELYVGDQRPLVRCMAYGLTYAEAFNIYLAVMGIVRASVRQPVGLSAGYTGLLRMLVLETGPTQVHDPDVDLPFLLFFLRAMIAESAVVTP